MDSTYSTAFHIVGSFYDIQIEFAKMEPILEADGSVSGDRRIPLQRIILPVGAAKDLAQKLCESLENYEKTFGEIRMPPQVASE